MDFLIFLIQVPRQRFGETVQRAESLPGCWFGWLPRTAKIHEEGRYRESRTPEHRYWNGH